MSDESGLAWNTKRIRGDVKRLLLDNVNLQAREFGPTVHVYKQSLIQVIPEYMFLLNNCKYNLVLRYTCISVKLRIWLV